MKATPNDIKFARQVAEMLRASVRPAPPDDLYAACLNAERANSAALYEAAAAHMAATGEWTMPDHSDLEAAKASAWAVLAAA